MRLLFPLLVLGFVALTLTPAVPAASSGCAQYSFATGNYGGTPVPAPYPNFLGGPCSSTAVKFNSGTPPCPLSPIPTVMPGEYCGPIGDVLPGATVVCTAQVNNPAKERFEALVIGLDVFPYDGHISPVEQLVHGGVFPSTNHATKVTNANGLPARVIAYPTHVHSPGPVYVNCV